MISRSRIIIGSTSVVLSVAAFGWAVDGKMPIEKAPAAVREAVKKVLGEKAGPQIRKESEDGKTIFEVAYKVGDVEHSASFAEDGKLLEQEEAVKMEAVPAAVAGAITKAAASSKVDSVMKVDAEGKTFYEATYTSGEDKHEIQVAQDGSVMSNKVEKDEDDEKDEKDEKKEKKA